MNKNTLPCYSCIAGGIKADPPEFMELPTSRRWQVVCPSCQSSGPTHILPNNACAIWNRNQIALENDHKAHGEKPPAPEPDQRLLEISSRILAGIMANPNVVKGGTPRERPARFDWGIIADSVDSAKMLIRKVAEESR
jgi:hypothetical protein